METTPHHVRLKHTPSDAAETRLSPRIAAHTHAGGNPLFAAQFAREIEQFEITEARSASVELQGQVSKLEKQLEECSIPPFYTYCSSAACWMRFASAN